MKIHKKIFSQALRWNNVFPLLSTGSQISAATLVILIKINPLTSASPLISDAPYMCYQLEIVSYTNNVYTKMHIEVCNNGALQKLLVFT